MKESMFNVRVKVNDEEYLYNSKNNGLIKFDGKELSEENKKYLIDNGYYVNDDFDEIAEIEKEVNDNIFGEQEELLLTVALTERCNFRCVYCYQEHEPKTLKSDNAKKLINTVREILSSNNYKSLRIHYFGGEPLLNLEMLYFLHDEFQKFSREFNIKYEPFITTNGSMLNRDILSKVRFRNVQLTFDGLEETHNKLRKSDNFKFKDTINLIPDILELADNLTVRYNICEENKNDLIPLIDYLMTKFGTDKIRFITAQTIKFSEEDKITMVSFDEYAKLSLEARIRLSEYGKKFTLPQSVKFPCQFLNGNAYSITSDLTIKKCEESSIILDIFTKDVTKKRRSFKVDRECRNCRILPLCLGGCNKTKETGFKSCVPVKNNIEDIIKIYIKEA